MDSNQSPENSSPPTGRSPVKWLGGTHNTVRNHVIGMMGEFCGTFLFLFFSFSGTQIAVTASKASSPEEAVAKAPNTPNLLYISLAFSSSVAVNVWAFYRISGGMLNPAVTLGLCLIKAVPAVRGLLVFPCQILGAIAAAGVVSALFPGPLVVGVSLSGGTSIVQGLFIEMFLTIQLVFVVFMLAAEKHRGTFMAPIGIGLSLFIAHMTGVYYTGAGVNPARALAPDVINTSFPGYHWIYWLGPFLGSLVASVFYYIFKRFGYQTANPGQDASNELICLLHHDEETPFAVNAKIVNLSDYNHSLSARYGHAAPRLAKREHNDVNGSSGANKPDGAVATVQEGSSRNHAKQDEFGSGFDGSAISGARTQ